MPGVIDADTHVIESEGTWQFFDEDLSLRRPALVAFPDPNTGRPSHRWVIDGKLFPKPPGKGGAFLHTPPVSEKEALEDDWACRSLANPAARIAHADEMGVATQVIYPTLFISYLTDDVRLEIALCRSYNRFLSQVWAAGQDRLRWVAPLPLRSIDASIEEMHYVKDHGAVGILFRGIEDERSMAEPYFYPIYEEASKLDLPVCIHIGGGSPALNELVDTRYMFNFASQRMLPVVAFHDILSAKLPERFPDLRIGFIEATASWVPFVLHFLKRRRNMGVTAREKLGPELLRDYRLYIACEVDEDIPYLLTQIGEDNLITGSDHGHHDQSAEPELVSVLRSRTDVPPLTVEKILSDNARRFYGIA
jgi:predicted TIM-barrel fold metal-dependent hydrolase